MVVVVVVVEVALVVVMVVVEVVVVSSSSGGSGSGSSSSGGRTKYLHTFGYTVHMKVASTAPPHYKYFKQCFSIIRRV